MKLPAGRLETKLKDKAPLYTRSEAITEASRCIYCSDAPCVTACPTSIDIPTFIHKIATENVKGSARTIFEQNLLGSSCARVCPVEVLCAGSCVYNHWGRPPIEIGRLQRYATENAVARDPELLSRTRKPATGMKIACVGGGPASLAAAGHLALDGHSVVIFEQKRLAGGLNTTGVAPYKLMAEDSLREVEMILALGEIELRTGVEVVSGEAGPGQVSAASLLADFDAVFVGIGLGPDTFLSIEGEEGPGVVGATAYIERLKLDPELKLDARRVIVVGGGNTAIDVAREAAQLGVPDVAMVYRRTAKVMSGYAHEMDGGRHDGVRLVENRQPVRVVREGGRVVGLEVEPTDGEGARETLPCDLIALAIGQSRLTKLAAAFEGVALDGKGRVVVDEATCRTGNPKVYAGGDCVNGGKEVVNAAQHGKLAARAITASFLG
ncbi:MAG: FAD-dependent oxidoreductase [Sandaracinaceae bacterium]|nr:FAD-dependent oxidoreductase [Sandaracinaceae bacterium]